MTAKQWITGVLAVVAGLCGLWLILGFTLGSVGGLALAGVALLLLAIALIINMA